jgi:hypothetical protein
MQRNDCRDFSVEGLHAQMTVIADLLLIRTAQPSGLFTRSFYEYFPESLLQEGELSSTFLASVLANSRSLAIGCRSCSPVVIQLHIIAQCQI